MGVFLITWFKGTGVGSTVSSKRFDASGVVHSSHETISSIQTTTRIDLASTSTSNSALSTVNTALQSLNAQRASLGALSNRIDHIVANNTNISMNITRSISRIEDADFAAETTNLAKQQILQQAAVAMLAQANASKQNVLGLLQQ